MNNKTNTHEYYDGFSAGYRAGRGSVGIHVQDYPVVTLCGSTKFKDYFIEAQKKLTLQGYIVLSVGLFGHSGDDEVWTEGTKEMLDDMHKRKIDLADEIYVINPGGYIGSSTKSEIEYATIHGKKINYLEVPKLNKIASFKIDHTKLLPGLYVSREDDVAGNTITTFDIRVCQPNTPDMMGTGEIHTIEHIIATYLRNDTRWEDKVIYFGPMGCRSGFYLILAGKYSSEDILPLVRECFGFVSTFEGEIPGASAIECGNYLDMDLSAAKTRAKNYASVLENITADQLVYPK